MTDLLLTILLMSLVCCGAHVVINDDVLAKYKKNYQMRHGREVTFHWSLNPFFACCRCMASVWGGGTYFLVQLTAHPYDFYIRNIHFFNIGLPILLIIPAIIATAFLNSVFINYYYSKS